MSSEVFKTKLKTRIAGLYASNARPVTGETVTISGYLQWYDPELRRWEPLEGGDLKLLIDGVEVGNTRSGYGGFFAFTHVFKEAGKYTAEVRYGGTRKYEPSDPSSIVIKVMTEEQRRKIIKLLRFVVIGFILLIAAIVSIAILLTLRE